MVFPRSGPTSFRYIEGDRTMGVSSPNKRRASDATRDMPAIDPPTKRLRSSEGLTRGTGKTPTCSDGQLGDVKGEYLATAHYGQQPQGEQNMLPKLSFQQYRMKEQLRAYMEEEVRRMRCEQKHRSCGYLYEDCSKGPGDAFGGLRVFRRRQWRLFKKRLWRFDQQYWVFSAGIPLCIMTYFGVYVGCVVMDKQYEMKYLRKQSLSYRENTLEDEHRMMADMIERAKDDFEMVPVPNQAR
ncbi:hypothetical protein FOZ61_002578 [Perkinsus olseni]|uniref:Uncharacterized protein n=1 Tax=Perkinsus olseni TaxID=32597 RepID=A0A7J6LSP0_PEROL|nr:hypothetical protein FOZ61_002578 [Perkinsus olseni]KAF4663742.1 hypothetical protein FOL46_004600 [Perkinsus olseni]